jgi:ADP-ribosylglycohydrolase
MRIAWLMPEELVPPQLVQSRAEGVDVTAVAERWAASDGSREVARELLAELDAATPEMPGATVPELERLPAAADLAERLHGAWTGRAAGCLLGKPVEGLPPETVREVLETSGQWPPRDYITAAGVPDGVAWHRSSVTSLRENIDGMPEDDDINFAILALLLLERYGDGLTTEDVARAWLDELPAGRTFTAERVAYRNLLDGVPVSRTALVANPFREWIGAQIRTDAYGWSHPGDRTAAGRLAVVDARLSHTRAGVDGAVWVAAMSAAAMSLSDPRAVVEAGLEAVPASGELARAVRYGIDLAGSARGVDDGLAALHREYGGYHWVHAVNNSALAAYALVASGGDFTTGIGIAVMGGLDTDSVGATVGAILGAASGVPERWAAPLDNRIATSLPGLHGVAIDELARRTLALTEESR